MDYVLFGFMIALFPLDITGTRCYLCQDRQSPSECLNLTDCPPDHQCHVRKYVNTNANITYDLGCMPEWFCDKVNESGHQKRQNEIVIWNRCCVSDYCNRRYNEDGKLHDPGSVCRTCIRSKDPHTCVQNTECKLGQRCYTKENIDGNETTYTLGCIQSHSCKQDIPLVGRRRGPADQCFDCCATDECNYQLCSSRVPDCPDGFVQWNDSCYLFNTTQEMNWSNALAECQGHGASLVSINSKEEDLFIVTYLSNMKAPVMVLGIWLGAVYDKVDNRYKWSDGSDVTYTRFLQGEVRKDVSFYIELRNPVFSYGFDGWPWDTDVGQYYERGFVCEKEPYLG